MWIFKKKNKEKTCNEEINIKDVRNDLLYTQDNNLMMYIRIQPFNYELLSVADSKKVRNSLAGELSSVVETLKFFSIARPANIEDLVNFLNEKLEDTTSRIRKQLLKKMLSESKLMVLKGEAVERQCVLIIRKESDDYAEKELKKITSDISQRLDTCGIKNQILNEQEIIQLVNSFTNMNLAGKEDADYEDYIPVIKEE